MKTIKITKKMFNSAEELLKSAGAVKGNRAFPYFVYMNPKDYKKLARNVKSAFRKQYPFLNTRKINSSTGMYLLNLGPTEVAGIKEGYLVIDDKQINNAILDDKGVR